LIALELHHMAFYALFVAAGAFAAAAVAVVAPEAIALQTGAAVVVAGAGIVGLRGKVSAFVHRHEGGAQRLPGVHGGLVGQEVLTLDEVGGDDRPGHVRLAGENWLAVSGGDHPIAAGTAVLVTAVRGTTLIVWPVDGHLPPPLPSGSNGETEPEHP
jgi:membrane protein implicated in regulation of membrane protease activity